MSETIQIKMNEERDSIRVIRVYRDLSHYVADEPQVLFETEPFLTGVGCGTGNNFEYLAENIKKAQEQGYRLVIVGSGLIGRYNSIREEDKKLILGQLEK